MSTTGWIILGVIHLIAGLLQGRMVSWQDVTRV